jgi:hypothetical protein
MVHIPFIIQTHYSGSKSKEIPCIMAIKMFIAISEKTLIRLILCPYAIISNLKFYLHMTIFKVILALIPRSSK